MANIILPQVGVLSDVTDSAKFLIEQNGEINRYYVSNLEVDVPTLTELLAQDSMILSSYQYGDTLPTSATAGRAFFIPDNTLDLVYPVGAIYLSVDATSPASLFGGTWEQIQDRFLLAAGSSYSVGSTGGESEHTLTIDEMPRHIHNLMCDYNTSSAGQRGLHLVKFAGHNTAGYWANFGEQKGGNQPHNNMPPYLAVYMWKRIA